MGQFCKSKYDLLGQGSCQASAGVLDGSSGVVLVCLFFFGGGAQELIKFHLL